MTNKVKRKPRRVPGRDDRYMGLAFWIASFSKDPDTQMGAVIISSENQPLGSGYNGPPSQYNDFDVDWSRPAKYDDTLHAEDNAIDYSCGNLSGASIYVTGLPCKKCMLRIVRSGIKKVIYFQSKHDSGSMLSNEKFEAESMAVAKKGSIRVIPFEGNLNWMRDRIKVMQAMGIFD